jgi:hypothetical protein
VLCPSTDYLLARTLSIRLGGIVALVDDQILESIILPLGEVGVEDILDAVGVALLRVE